VITPYPVIKNIRHGPEATDHPFIQHAIVRNVGHHSTFLQLSDSHKCIGAKKPSDENRLKADFRQIPDAGYEQFAGSSVRIQRPGYSYIVENIHQYPVLKSLYSGNSQTISM
jgi:hypothetical protein